MQDMVPAPPPYHYHADEDGNTEPDDDRDGFPFQWVELHEPEKYGEPGIDEISPDEDERAAEAALLHDAPGSPVQYEDAEEQYHEHQDEEATQFQDVDPRFDDSLIDPVLLAKSEHQSGEDVVRMHHQCNGFLRAPAPERLRAICDEQQLSTGIAVSVAAGNTEGSMTTSSNLPSKNSPTQLTALDGKLDGHPSKLHSYPFGFRQVIERAKLIAQCDCATKNPFPSRSTFLDVSSTEIFSKALLRCENVSPGYWPNYHSPLAILLWEAMMTWRSTIKSKAREILPRSYDIGPHRNAQDNQALAHTLINQATFLRDGVDHKGSTNNMANPALAALVTNFFYSSPSLNSVFPEVFSRQAPKVAVCLAATALQATLDEYTQDGTRQDRQFEFATYSKIFAGYLNMQHQIDQAPKHTMKMREL